MWGLAGYEDDDDHMTLQETLSAGLSAGLADGGAASNGLHTAVAISGGEATAGEEHGTAFVTLRNGSPDGEQRLQSLRKIPYQQKPVSEG